MITIDLPWPPSVNHYYARNRNGSVRIDKRGLAYRRQVFASTAHLGLLGERYTHGERLAVRVDAYPPDRRKRDLGNLDKCLMDALQQAEVFLDDEQIDDLRFVRKPKVLGGHVTVTIEVLK